MLVVEMVSWYAALLLERMSQHENIMEKYRTLVDV
jgi:hypothetical protein